ncbi:MAG: AarF/ABC1/UbiB kinase family protein, partial [Cyanobacteria bacterium J06636_28]
FRWNRLENLLRNARSSQDYDLANVLEQTINYLFSERGDHIRDHIADELAKSLDQFGHSLVKRLQTAVSQDPTTQASATQTNDWEHISRIVSLLGETRGMDGGAVVRLVPQVLAKPETRQMGQRVARNLAQRAAARLLRTIFMPTPGTPQMATSTPLLSAQEPA